MCRFTLLQPLLRGVSAQSSEWVRPRQLLQELARDHSGIEQVKMITPDQRSKLSICSTERTGPASHGNVGVSLLRVLAVRIRHFGSVVGCEEVL
jgi:hypothetical protein